MVARGFPGIFRVSAHAYETNGCESRENGDDDDEFHEGESPFLLNGRHWFLDSDLNALLVFSR